MSRSIYGKVTDWTSDFDHADPEYNERVFEIWNDLRRRCPVAHTTRYDGAWLPVTHAHVREIAYDVERFNSRGVIVTTARPDAPGPIGDAPPITSDPPFHAAARRVLLPPFAPKVIARRADEIRAVCRARLDAIGRVDPGTTVVDAAVAYAQHIPVTIIARMLGFPADDDEIFREFVHAIVEAVNTEPAVQEDAGRRLDDYLDRQIEAHEREPREDVTTYLLEARLFGEPLSREQVRGSMALLLLAGIDTTWSAIGSSLWHLASHPADLERLVAEPQLMPTAIEEFLRAYAPVTMARMVAVSHDFHGHAMQEGDWVLLPFPAANRDPAVFADADIVRIDRAENRHAAFGLGAHRCIGSNLARLEMTIAIEEFLARFPRFELADPPAVVWSIGQVRGPRRLRVRILEAREP
jgi:cytochrome P450